MSELTLTAVRLGLLAALWLFVLSVVAVIRTDIYGTQVRARSTRARRAVAAGTAGASGAAPRGAGELTTEPGGPGYGRNAPTSLVVTEGSLAGTTMQLGPSPILIGRNPEATLVLDDDYASGRHARIYPEGGRWFVEDLASTNGTFLGRERLSAPTPLSAGSVLRIGQTQLELRK